MKWRMIVGLLVVFNGAALTAATPTINVGTYYLLGNTPNQTIQISVTGGDSVPGVNLYVQVGDGGPALADYGVPAGTPGPAITSIDLKGLGSNPATIFHAIPDSQTNYPGIPQVASASIAIAAPGGTVPASGTLANLTIDTTGFNTANQSFNLQLSNVLPFSSLGGPYATDFADESASIANGSIVIAVATNSAYWQGSLSNNWSTDTFTNTGTNWTTDATGVLNTHAPPGANTDVFFTTSDGGSHLSTVLGADFSIKGLTFTSAAVNPVSIGGGNTLTIGADGLTMQSGAASPTISAAVNLGIGQTWTINGPNPLLIGGTLSTGAFALDKLGGGTLRVTGAPILGAGGSLQVGASTVQFNLTSTAPTIGTGFGVSVSDGATLELAGSVSALGVANGGPSGVVNVVNNSRTALTGGVHVTGTNQQAGTITGTGDVVVESTANLSAYQLLQHSLTINGSGRVTLLPSGSGTVSNQAAPNNINYSSNLGSLTIGGATNAWTGTLDIGNNGLVIPYGTNSDPFMTLTNMVKSGYANGLWTGTGITSSLARSAAALGSPTPALNIGLIDFVPNGPGFGSSISFEGQTITTSAVLIRLTYMDDLVLAGDMAQANATSDALFFAANYGSGTTWGVGDLTHDGVIDTNDALLFAANYVVGLPSLDGTTGNAAVLGGGSAVPEPASLMLALVGLSGLSAATIRRHRRK